MSGHGHACQGCGGKGTRHSKGVTYPCRECGGSGTLKPGPRR